MIQFSGLTPRQIQLYKKLQGMVDHQEIKSWLMSLDQNTLNEVCGTIHLMIAEYLDQTDLGDCAQACQELERIRKL